MTKSKSEPHPGMAHLSDNEVGELDQFLMSNTTSDATMMIDSLDGYLTAIAIGPTTLTPAEWLPGIWGLSISDATAFESMELAQRIFNLLLRHLNGIIRSIEDEPNAIAPIFNRNRHPDDLHEHLDAESWARVSCRVSACVGLTGNHYSMTRRGRRSYDRCAYSVLKN